MHAITREKKMERINTNEHLKYMTPKKRQKRKGGRVLHTTQNGGINTTL